MSGWEAEPTKRWTAGLFMALIFMYNHVGALAETSARAACILEMETGRVLFASDMHARLPMASTTKVMTALLAIERGRMDDAVVCSKNAFGVPGTSIYLQEGETLTLEEMLLGLMLASGNDAAVAIAEHIGGTTEAFVAMMNARAREIGAVNTRFANPHGLPDENHYTTAYDLALIAREAMGNEAFRRLVATQRASISWPGRAHNRTLSNKNRLLSTYPGATGVKTGFTSKAGRCLVFGAQRDELELVGAVLSCSDWFDEAARLMDGCFETYTMARVLGPTLSAGRIAVTGGEADTCGLCVMQPLSVPLQAGEAAQVVLDVPASVRAPVYPGQYLGTARIVVDGHVYGEGEVVASERVDRDGIHMDVRRIMAQWML